MSNIDDKIQEWLKLSNQGLFIEAKIFYFNNLFDNIINRFVDVTSYTNQCDVLFSILGFSPEPIVLTQRALAPSVHVIFTTHKSMESDNEIISYLEKYLTSNYRIVNLDDDNFGTIYDNLKAQMNIFPSSKYVIDITGGKKSMVASAAIFARDYNCNVVYVDYEEYIPELRRPMPGTEKLNVVYSAIDDFVNVLDLPSIKLAIEENVNKHPISPKSRKTSNESSHEKKKTLSEPYVADIRSSIFQKAFIDAFNHYVGEETVGCRNWLPSGIGLLKMSERKIKLRINKTGETIELQRPQLLDFFCKCKNKQASAREFIGGTSQRAKKLNPAICGLLNVINFELFEERF